MEFDHRIPLKETGRTSLVSDLSPEALHKRVWEICSASAAHIGEAGAGEFWLDHSDLLRTRHLVVSLSLPETAGTDDPVPPADPASSGDGPLTAAPPARPGAAAKTDYALRFRAGSKLNYLGDVAVMVLVLLAFWCLSKLLVPQPPAAAIAGSVLAAGAAAGLFFWAGRDFGKKETDELIHTLRGSLNL